MAKQRIPMLVGVSGYCQDEKFPLQYGKTLVVGRSRTADLSLRRLPSYLTKSEEDREQDEAFRTVSGRHFEITLFNLGAIEIKNLSGNGTLVDGKPIDALVIDDISDRSHKIEIGINEKFSLEMGEYDPEEEAARKADAAKAAEAALAEAGVEEQDRTSEQFESEGRA